MTPDTSITLHRRGSGRCLVLLHCLGVDRHFWDFVAPLSRELTLVSYDLPGHGETPVPNGPYNIEDLAAQLAGPPPVTPKSCAPCGRYAPPVRARTASPA